jgi:two-component system cell cycle response regulator DivK
MSGAAEPPPQLRVLIVDDDVDVATVLSYVLQVLGCHTATAYGSIAAVQIGQLFKPALVLIDLELAGEDGCEVLMPLRALDDLAQTLFVCLAASADPGSERRALEAGFDRFVHKPIDPHTMNEILVAANERRRLLREESTGGVQPLA